MIDRSYKVTRYRYECEYCGRLFESDGPWAVQNARECERECEEKKKDGLQRVYLPPAVNYDPGSEDKHWKFVKKGEA